MGTNHNRPDDYHDIIDLPHHVSSYRPRMSMLDRAAQFSPFAALTGFGDVIKETARPTDRKPELSEEEKTALDYKLWMASDLPGEKPEITVTYFAPDDKKSGGAYCTISGRIKKIDPHGGIVMDDGTRIDVDHVLDIDGEIYAREGR